MGSISRKGNTLRLILGDQLNINHSWFSTVEDNITYVMMETRSETDYTRHHIQKLVGFFVCMRRFSHLLKTAGHDVIYIPIDSSENLQAIDRNVLELLRIHGFKSFEYQLPDEYRVDQVLSSIAGLSGVSCTSFDTEHFYTHRNELGEFFGSRESFVMETFYRYMRKKHHILMDQNGPLHGKWNFDAENRKKLPQGVRGPFPLVFENNVDDVYRVIESAGISFIGELNSSFFSWPVDREQALQLLDYFAENCLQLFGTYQDAMATGEWSLYHSRLSFALNIKLISPVEVVNRVIREYELRSSQIEYNQIEGFVRQIIGWREFMRGVYWNKMPDYAQLNYFNNTAELPWWYWNGKTKMNCLKNCISQSLEFAYAHHIQRLMVTGNFALLAGVHPDEVDQWYLGIYIDALEWVEITNTRGMSQYADGGLLATKPYVSSAAYINKMSNYCSGCYYNKDLKVGERSCPFNSLYWHFLAKNESLLVKNPRVSMMYSIWYKFSTQQRNEILDQAEFHLANVNEL